MPSILTAAIAAFGMAPLAAGHTWIEQLRNVNGQGQYVGEYGYPRGMVSKTDPGFSGTSMNWELPAYDGGGAFITEKTTLCHPEQRQQKQSQDKYPRLQVTPGGFIAMRYMENGHVSLPNNQKGKPKNGGTVFVYGTTQPDDNEKLANVLQWTQDGQGGNKRGVLIAMNDYDDGRCYEMNNSPISQERQVSDPNFALGQVQEGAPKSEFPLFCETNAVIPNTTESGKPYTIYWVWQWNTAPGIDPGLPNGKDEYYSTCIDVDVADTIAKDVSPELALGQQDAMSTAVKDFKSRTAIITNALEGEVGPVFSGTPTATPPQTTLATTIGAPFLNSTAPQIPTLTGRPSPKPTSGTPADNVVTVTETAFVTVTAPAITVAPPAITSALTAASEYARRHVVPGAKFRGRFLRD